MFQQLFQLGQTSGSGIISDGLSTAESPVAIARVSLQHLLSIVSKKDKELRDSIQNVLDSLPSVEDDDNMDGHNFDPHFDILQKCIESTSNPKLVQSTLTILEKFVKEDILRGHEHLEPEDQILSTPSTPERQIPPSVSTSSITPPKILMDNIISVLSNCAKANISDDETLLIVIRCIMAAVLSHNNLVHGNSLMSCVRTCYSINKDSKSSTVQQSATSSLTDMLNHVITSVEASSIGQQPSDISFPTTAWCESYTRNLITKTIVLQDPDNEELDNRGKYGWCVVCNEPANYHCMKSRDPVCSIACKRINLKRLEIVSSSHALDATTTNTPTTHQDILTVLRSLCKLSSTTSGGGTFSTAIPDIRIVKAKRLSLELISSILESSGPKLKSDPQFVEVIQHVLFVSLLTNAVSPVPKLFTIALYIFGQLVSENFRKPLIREIGVFIDKVLLYILESENASCMHKLKVMEIFLKIFSNAKYCVEIFQFFDCSIGERNVFELSVNCIAGVAIGKFSGSTIVISDEVSSSLEVIPTGKSSFTAEQQIELRSIALRALISVVESGHAWACPAAVGTIPDTSVHPSPTPSAVPADGAAEAKHRKNQLETALKLFKSKPEKGIAMMIESGFISSSSPRDIAIALKKTPDLDKTAIGELIGDYKESNLQIFYEFVDLFSFSNRDLDDALRYFLAHFRLPGEAQKIDRIMEKFAEKFFKDNPEKYPNADCAYVLSFAIIMLNTDLHSAQIKKKMTVEEFVKLGKNINTEIEISEDELVRLYRNIERDQISLSEDDERRKMAAAAAGLNGGQTTAAVVVADESDPVTAQRRRFEMFVRETEQMMEKARSQLVGRTAPATRSVVSNGSVGFTVKVPRKPRLLSVDVKIEDLIPLMNVACWPVLYTLSVVLRESPGILVDDSEVTAEDSSRTHCKALSAIDCIRKCMEIASSISMDDVVGEKCMQTLHAISVISDLKSATIDFRSILAINCMISIAASAPHIIGNSWGQIVETVSQIDRWNYTSFRLKAAAAAESGVMAPPTSNRWTGSGGLIGGAKNWWNSRSSSSVTALSQEQIAIRELQGMTSLEKENLEFILSLVNLTAIDLIFIQSPSLSPASLLTLIESLVETSGKEISAEIPYRLYSLQKLVEVADFNMNRIRIVWGKIWSSISLHLVAIAVSPPQIEIASFAIDSLRQLTLKYLTKSELSNYHFQAEFLKPFLAIMVKSTGNVQELILNIICSLAKTVPENLKSGWISIFGIISAATKSAESAIVATATNLLSELINTSQYRPIRIEYFREFFEILIQLLRRNDQAENYEKIWKIVESNIGEIRNGEMDLIDTNRNGVWLVIFRGLASLLTDFRKNIRQKSSGILFTQILASPGDQLKDETIQIFIRGVMLPLYDDIVHMEKIDFSTMVISEISTAFSKIIAEKKNFEKYFSKFIPEIMGLNLVLFTSRGSDKFSIVAIDSTREVFLKNINSVFECEEWINFCIFLSKYISSTLPSQLVANTDNYQDLSELPFSPSEVMNVCSAHLAVLGLVGEVLDRVSSSSSLARGLFYLEAGVSSSHNLAVDFNMRTGLREKLKKLGFMKDLRQLPKLVKQEITAVTLLIRILSLTHKNGRLKSTITNLVERYAERERMLNSVSVQVQDHVHEEIEGSISGFSGLISGTIFNAVIGSMTDDDFVANRGWIFELILKLIPSSDLAVRKAAADCLAKRFRP